MARGIFERGDGAIDGFARRLPQVHHPARVALVGLDRARLTLFDPRHLAPLQRQVEALAQFVHDPILQREDVLDLAVDLHGAAQLPGRHVDEVRGDPDHPAEALVSADDDPGRAEAAADIDRERVVQMRVRYLRLRSAS